MSLLDARAIRTPLVVAGVAAAALAASGAAPARFTEHAATGHRDIAAVACGPREAAQLVDGLLVAFNAGDRRALQPYFGAGFFAYSVREGHLSRPPAAPEGGRFVVAKRPTILAHLRRRHELGERQRLLVIEVNERFGRGTAGAGVYVRREASDLAGLGIRHRFASAKIEIDCRRRSIVVWNMVMPRDPPPTPPECRRPRWWTGARTIIACRSNRADRIVLVARS